MRIGPFGVWEILIILIVVLLIFGPRRLPEMAKGLGQSVRAFRKEMRDFKEDLDADSQPSKPAPSAPSASTPPPPAAEGEPGPAAGNGDGRPPEKPEKSAPEEQGKTAEGDTKTA